MSESIAFISPESVPEKMATVASAPKKQVLVTSGSKRGHWIEVSDEAPTEAKPMTRTDSNKYTDKAKQLVVDNYNSHHDSSKTPPLTIELVYVVWFSKVLDSWKAMIGSSVVKGLLYEVTYNGARSEAYVDVYKKINNVKIAD